MSDNRISRRLYRRVRLVVLGEPTLTAREVAPLAGCCLEYVYRVIRQLRESGELESGPTTCLRCGRRWLSPNRKGLRTCAGCRAELREQRERPWVGTMEGVE